MGEERGDHARAASITLVLADSPDVMASLGRPGFLAQRIRASSPRAPQVEIVTIPGERCDVVAQRLQGSVDRPGDVPPGAEAWLAAATTRHDLPASARIVVISMCEALTAKVVRHRDEGWLAQLPNDYRASWPQHHVDWIDDCFVPVPADAALLDAALSSIDDQLELRDAACIVFGVSTYAPGEKVYWFREGDPEPTAIRATRVNLVLDSLDESSRLAVVPIDRIVAEYGAADAVAGCGRYSPETAASIAEEAANLIAARPRIGVHFSPDTMRLTVPRYDRRTAAGTLLKWHIAAPAAVSRGDPLFDVRFEHLHTRLNAAVHRESQRALRITVVASRDGYLQETVVADGAHVEVGTTVGVFTTKADAAIGTIGEAPPFPVGVKLLTR